MATPLCCVLQGVEPFDPCGSSQPGPLWGCAEVPEDVKCVQRMLEFSQMCAENAWVQSNVCRESLGSVLAAAQVPVPGLVLLGRALGAPALLCRFLGRVKLW